MDRQKILILFGVAWLSAACLTWFVYATTVAPKQEARTLVYAPVRDLPVGAIIHKSDLKRVNVLSKELPKGALMDERQAIDRVALYPFSANQPLIDSSLSRIGSPEGIPATIPEGYRAVSVQINDVSGVAGLILPGSRVDVLFTRVGSMAEAVTSTILQNVKVLAMGKLTQVGQAVDPKAPKVPVATLVVNPEQAKKLELAKNEGRISLALRNPLDPVSDVDATPMSTEVLDPMAATRGVRGRVRPMMAGKTPNLDDPSVWKELTGPKPEVKKKETPPPPRAVVDVYRGDKHVQEIFHD
jgi:pilus assembly protein CpaB